MVSDCNDKCSLSVSEQHAVSVVASFSICRSRGREVGWTRTDPVLVAKVTLKVSVSRIGYLSHMLTIENCTVATNLCCEV